MYLSKSFYKVGKNAIMTWVGFSTGIIMAVILKVS